LLIASGVTSYNPVTNESITGRANKCRAYKSSYAGADPTLSLTFGINGVCRRFATSKRLNNLLVLSTAIITKINVKNA